MRRWDFWLLCLCGELDGDVVWVRDRDGDLGFGRVSIRKRRVSVRFVRVSVVRRVRRRRVRRVFVVGKDDIVRMCRGQRRKDGGREVVRLVVVGFVLCGMYGVEVTGLSQFISS